MFIYLLLRKHQIKIYWFDVVEKDRTEGIFLGQNVLKINYLCFLIILKKLKILKYK